MMTIKQITKRIDGARMKLADVQHKLNDPIRFEVTEEEFIKLTYQQKTLVSEIKAAQDELDQAVADKTAKELQSVLDERESIRVYLEDATFKILEILMPLSALQRDIVPQAKRIMVLDAELEDAGLKQAQPLRPQEGIARLGVNIKSLVKELRKLNPDRVAEIVGADEDFQELLNVLNDAEIKEAQEIAAKNKAEKQHTDELIARRGRPSTAEAPSTPVANYLASLQRQNLDADKILGIPED